MWSPRNCASLLPLACSFEGRKQPLPPRKVDPEVAASQTKLPLVLDHAPPTAGVRDADEDVVREAPELRPKAAAVSARTQRVPP